MSVGMVLQAVIQVAMALLMRFVIDAALTGNGELKLWAVLLAADIIAQVCLHGLLSWGLNSTMDRMSASLREKIMESAVYSADSRLQAYHSGTLLSRAMEDVNCVCDGAVTALPSLVGQVTRLVAAYAAVAFIDPGVAVVLLLGGAAVVAGVSLLRPVLKAKHKQVREADDNVMSTMQEDLQKLELIQSIQAQKTIHQRLKRSLKKSLKTRSGRRVWTVGINAVLNSGSLLGTGALLLWGASRVAVGALSYGSLTSMLQLLGLFRTPILSLSGLWTRLTAIEVSAERLGVLLQIPEQPETKASSIPSAVVFENVTFCYPGDEIAVLENFSLRLPIDGWTSLGGMSGRGKTTLFKLILGLYAPQKGRVYLCCGEKEILCGPDTRHLFAYVPQDYALFSGTVLENLQLVAPDATEAQRRRALEIACATFIWDNQGESTYVSENNTGLSKGQLQRLAIARAVLMGHSVLLLDECTSALDAQTEKQVLENLHSFCPKAILVTHRPEALEGLDHLTLLQMEA